MREIHQSGKTAGAQHAHREIGKRFSLQVRIGNHGKAEPALTREKGPGSQRRQEGDTQFFRHVAHGRGLARNGASHDGYGIVSRHGVTKQPRGFRLVIVMPDKDQGHGSLTSSYGKFPVTARAARARAHGFAGTAARVFKGEKQAGKKGGIVRRVGLGHVVHEQDHDGTRAGGVPDGGADGEAGGERYEQKGFFHETAVRQKHSGASSDNSRNHEVGARRRRRRSRAKNRVFLPCALHAEPTGKA